MKRSSLVQTQSELETELLARAKQELFQVKICADIKEMLNFKSHPKTEISLEIEHRLLAEIHENTLNNFDKNKKPQKQ